MGMALSTTSGQTHPDRTRSGHPVDSGVEAKFKGVDTTFFIELGVTMKTSGNFLIVGGVRKHVSGKLFDGELIVGHVGIEGSNYPIPIGPNSTGAVFFVSIAVSIAGKIQPLSSPFFSVMRRPE